MQYRSDIDGLRAIAVGAVVLFHAKIPGFSGGFIGVDIFLVISGYLISKIILKDILNNEFSLINFYDRRIRRIFPALFVVYLFSYVLGLLLLMPEDLKALAKSLTSSVGFVSNFHFLSGAGYFDTPSIAKPLLHTWSLSVEEQFYIAWPLALIGTARFVSPRYWLPALIASCVISLGYSEWEIWHANATAAFYLPHARAWELLTGAVLAITLPKLHFGQKLSEGMALLGLILIAGTVALLSEQMDFPGLNAVFPCLGAAFIIVAGDRTPTAVGRLLSTKPFVFIGLISYSLYLWHWPLFSYWHLSMDRAPTHTEGVGLICLSLALAAISWRYIEIPFRNKTTFYSPKYTFSTGLVAMVFMFICGLSGSLTYGLPQRYDDNVTILYETANNRAKINCHYDKYSDQIKEECLLGHKNSIGPFDTVLVGDSHASHFRPAVDRVLELTNRAGRIFATVGCIALFDVELYNGTKLSNKCKDYNDSITKYLSKNNDADLVIIAARWSVYTESKISELENEKPSPLVDDIDTKPGNFIVTRRVLERALRRTVNILVQNGKQVLLMGQVPPYPVNPTTCVARARISGSDERKCFASTDKTLKHLGYSNNLLRKLAFESSSVHVFIPTDVLCTDEYCSLFLNGVFLYRDDDHLNAEGSKQFAEYLADIKIFSNPPLSAHNKAARLRK